MAAQLPEISNFSNAPQVSGEMAGYEVLSPNGAFLGLIERRFARAQGVENTTVTVEVVREATDRRSTGVRVAQLQVTACAGREVIRIRPDEARRLVGFVPFERLDRWALFRRRLEAIRRPIVTFSEGARDLGVLVDDVRTLMVETDGLSPGRVALIELAWQRMHVMHDPELASLRLTEALQPGPDLVREPETVIA